MSSANNLPIRVRGKDYPSVKAAAAALGIKPASVSSYLGRYGHTDGLGLGFSSPARNQTARRAKPVTICGYRFATVKAAADALGVNYQSLSRTLNRPMTDRSQRRLERLVGNLKAKLAAQADEAMRAAWAASVRDIPPMDRPTGVWRDMPASREISSQVTA